ncbi:MAG TPA: phenylalanine--tRNA ligase subunit beta [Paludibacteraceae bacterium]|nr:phenylalanine--tRNA ligase subunit beta [Paludibacteraceae bacterium]
MNISYQWLKTYLATEVAPVELGKILTSIGLEVGAVETVQTIKGGLEGLVVGEVLTCEPHENSDHLHVTTVTIGEGESLQIVCGASNVAAGQKVIVATIGTVLYSGDESFTIKRSKIRGVESLGMICAEDEIGVGKSHDGIMVLPATTKVGMVAKDYFEIHDDTVIEVDITPNRADAASHFGVARDAATYFTVHNQPTALTKPSVDAFRVAHKNLTIPVTVENSNDCPRYAGVTISNIHVKESPKWLQDRLNSVGIRPINNVVDATNYTLHAFGQPLHAFDADKIKGGKIRVKTVSEGTKFVTLDGVERKLSNQDLMICNAEEPMCMAGVFGGQDSGVTEQTTNIFIESAYFNPVTIRKTARRHGLNTDASFRYERGIDPNSTIYVLKSVALLIQELAGGDISSDIIDVYPTPIADFTVDVTLEKITALIGKEIPVDTIETIFKGLEMRILSKTDGTYQLGIPAYRVDVQRDVDVIEDIMRIYGYNNVEFSDSLKSNISYSQRPDSHKLENQISEQLTACGFNEILNNSLTKSSYYEKLATYPIENCVKLMNALSHDLDVMRQTLLFGGLENIAYNINRQNADLKFYEFGNCYHYNGDKRTAENVLAPYTEEYHVGLWLCGKRNLQSWLHTEEKVSFYELKAHVQNVLRRLGIELQKTTIIEFSNDLFSEGLNIYTLSGKLLATMGAVEPKLLKTLDINTPVYFADLQWKQLLKESAKHKVTYHEISKFPAVKRDLALLLDKQITFADVEKLARETERKLLKKVHLFDVYEGKNLEAGKKSYAVNFTLQDNEKTLNDKQIDGIMQKLIANFEEKLGAKLR